MERLEIFPDLGPAFNAGLVAFDTPRGDEAALHVSDLGKCDLAVWARRNGKEQIAHGPKTAARLQMGLHAEEFVVAHIEAGLPPGWRIERSPVLDGSADELVGHLDAILVSPEGFCAYFDVKTTGFREVWAETGEFYPDTGRPIKRKTHVPYDDFPGPIYHFQSGGYCRRMPVNPDGKHMPYAIAAFDWNSKAFVPFGWYDSDEPGFVQLHDMETKRKREVTAPGVDPVAAEIAIRRADGMLAGFPPADSVRANGKSWLCGYCDNIGCALNTNPDSEIL